MWDIPLITILLLANHLVNMPSLFPLKGQLVADGHILNFQPF